MASPDDNKASQVAFLGPDGVIHEEYDEPFTAEAVDRVAGSADVLIEALLDQGKPVLFLIDLSRVKRTNAEANLRAKRYLASRYFDRIALVGVPAHLKVVAELVTRASGKGDRIRYFDDAESALSWLHAG